MRRSRQMRSRAQATALPEVKAVHSEQLTEHVVHAPASRDEDVAAVGVVQDRLGNTWLNDALASPSGDVFSAVVVGEIGLATAGVTSSGGFVGAGNEAMIAAMDQAAVAAKRPGVDDVVAGPAVGRALAGSGSPLPSAVLGRMEAALGHDLGHVRIHTGIEADRASAEIQARAFAVGPDLFFAQGEYRPGTRSGDELLAHELTHVVQHDQGRLDGKSGVSSPYDVEEREADATAARVVAAMAASDSGTAQNGVETNGYGHHAADFSETANGVGHTFSAEVAGQAAPSGEQQGETEPGPASTGDFAARKAEDKPAPVPTGVAPTNGVKPTSVPTNGVTPVPTAVTADKSAPKVVTPTGGPAAAPNNTPNNVKDLVSAALTKAPAVVKAASTVLDQAQKKSPHGADDVKSRLPGVLRAKLKPLLDPLAPKAPGESVSKEALGAVVGAVVTTLPEVVRHASHDADEAREAAAKEAAATGDKPSATATTKGAPPAPPAPKATPDPSKAAPAVAAEAPKKDAPADAAADATTQFFITAISEAIASLVPAPIPAKAEELGPDGKPLAANKAKPHDKDGKVKAADPKKPDDKKDQKSKLDDMAGKKKDLDADLVRLKDAETRARLHRDELSAKMAELDKRSAHNRKELAERKAWLDHEGKKAKKAGKHPKAPNKDTHLHNLQRDAKSLPKEIAALKDEIEKAEKELADAEDKRAKEEQAIRALEAEMQAAKRAAAGGGGVHIPPPTDEVETAKKVLDAIAGKGKKIEEEAATALKKRDGLKTEIAKLETAVADGEKKLPTITSATDDANKEVKSLEGRIKARTAELNNAPTDGSAAPKAADDALLNRLKGELVTAKAKAKTASADQAKFIKQLDADRLSLKTKKKELEEAEKKLHDADKAKLDYDKALTSLKDKKGCPVWQKIATEYKVDVKPVPLAPGMTRDEEGVLVKIEDLKKKKKEAAGPPKTEEQLKKERADAAKKKAEEDAEEAKLSPKEKKDRADKKKKDEDDRLHLEISRAKDLPKAERDVALADIAKAQNKTIAQLDAVYNAKIAAAGKTYKPGMSKEEAEKAHISATDFTLLNAHNDRKVLQEKAFKTMGGKNGQDAVDALWSHARQRGLKGPGEMLTHLAYVDLNTVPDDLKEAAKRAKTEEAARIKALPPGAAADEAKKKADEAYKAAAKNEAKFGRNKEIAAKLDCSVEEAQMYIKSIQDISGGSEDEAATSLKIKGKKPGVPDEKLQQKLKEIHLLPVGEARKKALLALATEVGDPKILAGAALVPEKGDGVVLKGPVANKMLKGQLDAIDSMPPDQQWDALCNLARITNQDPNELERARRNLKKRNDVVNTVSQIECDESLTEKQKKERLTELAEVHKISVDQLRNFHVVETNKSANTITKMMENPDIKANFDKLNIDKKTSPGDRAQALKELARITGEDPKDIEQWANFYEFRQKKARWKDQFKSGSEEEAADKMAGLVEQYGSSDDAKQQLRDCPDDKLTPEMQKMKADLLAWDKEHPDQEVKAKLKQIDPATDKDYQKKRDALLKELNATWTKDSKALRLLQELGPEGRAALLREHPEAFEQFYKGVDGDADEGKAAAELFGMAKANNLALKKEAADDAVRAKSAGEVEDRVKAARQAALDLNLPFKEAKAHLDAVAAGNGMTPQQALVWLHSFPGKSPAEALKAAYATKPEKDSKEKINPILRARLDQIENLPPKDKGEAIKALKDLGGFDDHDMDKALTVVRHDSNVTKDMHAIRDLPEAERKAALKDLAEKYKVKDPTELDAIYKQSLERTATRLNGLDVLPKDLSMAPEDIDKKVKELALKSGQPESAIRQLMEARRTETFGADSARMLGGEQEAEAFKKGAADQGMSPSEYADWLARSPATMLPADQAALKAQLAKGGYKIIRSDAEKVEMKRSGLIADPADPDYRKSAAALTAQLQSGHEDADILRLYGQMTPAQQKLFREEYEAETHQSLSERFENSLQGSDEDRGLRMLHKARLYNQDQAEQAFGAVDTSDKNPAYTQSRDALAAELCKGDKANGDAVAAMLMAMPLNQRAAFLREYGELRLAAPQGVDMTDTKKRQKFIPPDLSTLLQKNPEALSALKHGQDLADNSQTPKKDAEKARRVRESIDIGNAAAAELGVTPRVAFSMIDAMAKDSGMSPMNALRFIQGKEPVQDESDKRSDFVKRFCTVVKTNVELNSPAKVLQGSGAKPLDKLNGQPLDEGKVQQALTFFNLPVAKSDATVMAYIQGCNPRELAALDAELKKRTPPTSLAEITAGVSGTQRKELGPALRGMEDFQTTESHYLLINTVKEQDPRRVATATTPEGFAQRLQWCKDLPPEKRLAELNLLRAEAGQNGFDSKSIMAAWLNGAQGIGEKDDPAMLSPGMQAQLAAIEQLPSKAAREKALEDLARLTNRWDGSAKDPGKDAAKAFQIAKDHTSQGLAIGKKMQEIEGMAEADKQKAILDLSKESKLSIDDLHHLHEQAQKAGLVMVGAEPVSPEVAKRLNEIRALPRGEQAAAIKQLQQDTGVSGIDINAHLQQDLEVAKKAIAERNEAHQGADSLRERMAAGDTTGFQKELDRYKDDPGKLKKVLDAYGPNIEKDMIALYGTRHVANASLLAYAIAGDEIGEYVAEHQIQYRLNLDTLAAARQYEAPPQLPEGVSTQISDEVRRIRNMKLSPDEEHDQLEALRSRKGIIESDFEIVMNHAAITQKQMELAVERKLKLLYRERDTGLLDYVDDSNVKAITKDISPEMLGLMKERCKDDPQYMGLFKNIEGGLGGDVLEDFNEKLNMAAQLHDLPMEDREKKSSEMRVEYKTKQLEEEFGGAGGDVARIKELLRDCTPEELKKLDEKFGGKLHDKIEEASQPSFWGTILKVAAIVAFGPLAMAVTGVPGQQADDQELGALKMRVKDATFDPNKPWDPETNRKKRDEVKKALGGEFDSWWTRDSTILSALKSLPPRDLAELMREWDDVHGAGSLEKSLRKGVSGEDLCQSIALLRNADDAAKGIDRGQQLKDVARQMAIKEIMGDLRKDPRNKDKSDGELLDLAEKDESRLKEKQSAKIKKVRDSANDIFKAIDGWGDNEEALHKTLSKLSPEESELVKIEYRRHFGKDLDTNLTEDLSGHDLQIAQELMDKDKRVDGLRHYVLSMSGSATLETWATQGGVMAAAEYSQSWGGLGEDEEGIYAAFEAMSPEERTKICQGAEGEAFLNRVKKHLGTNEQAVVDALTAINPESGVAEANPAHVAAAKIQLHMKGSGEAWAVWSGWGTDEEKICEELDKLTPEQVQEASKWYQKKFGTPLAAVLLDELGSDTREFAIVDAELRGDKVEADVHRLKWAAQDENDSTNWLLAATGPIGAAISGTTKAMGYTMPVLFSGTDEELLEKTLTAGKEGRGGRNAEHLEKVKARFNAMFADSETLGGDDGTGRTAIDRLIDTETSGVEKAFFSQLVAKGEADPELELIYSMAGWGTDEDRAKKVLEKMYDKSPAERDAFKKKFSDMASSMYGGTHSLEEWLIDDFSGTEGFEVKLLSMGKPTTPEEMYKIAKMRWEFERGEGNGFMNGFMDGLGALGATSAGEVFERDTMEMFALFDENGKLRPGVSQDKLEEISEWQGMDAKNYREVRDAVTDTVVNVVQVVGAVAIACIPGLQGVSAMIIANLVLAAATMGLKAMMKGNGFGWEEGAMDLAMAAVSAATAGVGAKLQTSAKIAAMAAGMAKAIGKAGAQKLIASIISEAISNGLQGFLNAALTSEDAMRKGDGAFFKHLLGGALGGAAQGAAGALGKGALGKTKLGKAMEDVQEGAFKGGLAAKMGLRFADGLISSTIQTVADTSQWEAWAAGKGIDAATLRGVFLQGIAQSVMGSAMEGSMKKAKLAGAIHEVTQGRERLAHLEAAISDAPVEHRAALIKEHEALKQHIYEQKSLVDLLHEDAKQETIKEHQREEVAQKIQKKIEPGSGDDPVNDAARRHAVEHALDETTPGKPHPGDPTDHAELSRRVADKEMLDAGRRAAAEDLHAPKPPVEGHVADPTDKIEANKRQAHADDLHADNQLKAINEKISKLREELHAAPKDKVTEIGLKLLDMHDELRAHQEAQLARKSLDARDLHPVGQPPDPARRDDPPPPPGGSGSRPSRPPDDPPPPGGGAVVHQEAKPAAGVQDLRVKPHGEPGARPQGPIVDALKHAADEVVHAGKRVMGKNTPEDDSLIACKRQLREPGYTDALSAHTPPDNSPHAVQEAAKQRARAVIANPEATPEAHHAAIAELISAHGNYMDVRKSLTSEADAPLRDQLTKHRYEEVSRIVHEMEGVEEGLRVRAHADPRTGDVVLSFEGARAGKAIEYLKADASQHYQLSPEKALGLRVSTDPVVVTPGAQLHAPANAHVSGTLLDPIMSHTDSRRFLNADGTPVGYQTPYGFHGSVAPDGAYEIRRAVVIHGDGGANLGIARSNIDLAIHEHLNAPQHRIVVDGVERVMRVVVDVQEWSGNMAGHPADAHYMKIHEGMDRADAANLHTQGRDATDSAAYVRATTAHELGHAILGLGDNYQDTTPQALKQFFPGGVAPAHLAADAETPVRSAARRAGGEHDIGGPSLMDGPTAQVHAQSRAVTTGETWESVAHAHHRGIAQAMEDARIPRPAAGFTVHDTAAYLRQTNEHLIPEGAAAHRPLTAGDTLVIPREEPHALGGLHTHQLGQIEWAIGRARASGDAPGNASFTQGAGGHVDELAAKAKGIALGRERFPHQNPEFAAMVRELEAADTPHARAAAATEAAHELRVLAVLEHGNGQRAQLQELINLQVQQTAAAGKETLGMHHSEWARSPEAQKALFEASGGAVARMKAAATDIVGDLPGVEFSSLRKRNNLEEFTAEVLKKQTTKNYASMGDMGDIVRGRFNVETAEQMGVVAKRLQEKFGANVAEVVPPRDGYPRWHVVVVDEMTGLKHEWQIGTKATTDFFERKSLTIPEGITAFKGAPDFHDGVYKLLNKVKDPEIRAQYGIDEMMPHYKKLTEETGIVTKEHPFPHDYEARYAEMAKGINDKLAAIERDRPGYMNDVLEGKVKEKPAAAKEAPMAPIRTANEASIERRAALGAEFSDKLAEASRGVATAPPGSPEHAGMLSRILDLDAIARNPNPHEAKAQLDAIVAVDQVAAARPASRANTTDAAEARAAIKAHPDREIPPHQAVALLDEAIGTGRILHMAETGQGFAEASTPTAQTGQGGASQRRVAEALAAMGVPPEHLTFHNTAESSQFTAAPDHSFTVARMPDGRLYLVDPNFGQFLSAGDDMVGRRLVSDPHGAAVAHALQRDGYVVLDDATARTYGRALTGHDSDFSAADFTRPNGTKTSAEADIASPEARAKAKAEYDTALRERDSIHARRKEPEPAPTGPDSGPVPERALAMHHSEFAHDPAAQESLFKASAGAVERMKAAGADIARDLPGAEVSSLRKRNTLEEFTTEVIKKQKAEGYEHVGKMCDIVRGRFNVTSGADVDVVVARLKEKFGDDVVKVKAPRDGYPRWHINVEDATTGLVHEWQVGTKATTSFFETKSLSIPESITAFKGAPDFHDGVYKLLNKISDPAVRAKYGIDEMLPGYKALAEATGKTTADHPFPEGYAEKYKEMTKAINDKLSAIERDNPGYMNKVLTAVPAAGPEQGTSHRTQAAADSAAAAPSHTEQSKNHTDPRMVTRESMPPTADGTASKAALAMHHSEFAKDSAAQEALFHATAGAVERMKSAGGDIVRDMPGAEVSSLRKRNTLEEFTTEVIKKQKSEGYEHIGKMCDIVRGRFNVTSGADVDMVVARLKETFGDDVVKVKAPRDGYPRWHINVLDATTGLVHEWQVGTKATTSFFETKSLSIPESITAFKGAPDFHDGVYKLLNKVTDPAIRAKYGIDDMLPGYKALAEATGKTTADHPFPEGYAEKYKEMTKAINDKLGAIERDTPGYMNHVLTGEPLAARTPAADTLPAPGPAARSGTTSATTPGTEVAAMHAFEGRVLVQYKNGAMQWMEPAQAAKLRVAETPQGVPVSSPSDKTLPAHSGVAHDPNKTLPIVSDPNKTLPLPEPAPRHERKTQPMEVVRPTPVVQAGAAQNGGQHQAGRHQAIQMPAVAAPQAGSQHAIQGQRRYANGSNTEFVDVDLQHDPALRRVLDRAHGATAGGRTLDEKLALLAAHVKDDITYDMAAQQNQYRQAQGGQVSLGQMIEQGSVVCREKALFTHAALAEMGIKSKVVVGTVPDGNGATGGHAWVELPNGTIIDGTWGRIFPAGQDPVEGRTRRSATAFAEPRIEMPGGEAAMAASSAAGKLSTPAEMDRLRRPQISPEEALVRPGVRAWHPDGRTPVTVEYSERNKVQVRHDDGRIEILDRRAFVGSNGWALQQGAPQQQSHARHTQVMEGYVPHPDIDAAGPDDRALSVMDARMKNHDLDKAVHEEVESRTKRGSNGHHYVDETYENLTVGAGFAGISNEVNQRSAGGGGRRLVIGEENPWLKARADLGQPAGESNVPGGQHTMRDTAETADQRFMHAREHAENAEINRAAAGVGLFKKKILGVELPPDPMDSSWHRPDAKARVAVLEGTNSDGSPVIRYIYAKRVDVASGPGPARKLQDKAMIRGRGPVPDNMDPAEFDRLAREGKIIPRQIDPALYAELLQSKHIMQSDQAFDSSHVREGEHVLVYGAGASAAWGVEGSAGKAGHVEWVGRMAKPGDDLTHNQNERLKAHYVALETARAANDPIGVERAMRHIESFTFTEAPNNGFLPRNLRDGGAFDANMQTEHGGNITRDVIPDLNSVTREVNPANGKTQLRIEAADGSVRWADRLVLAIGQDGQGPGGPGKLLEKIPKLHPLVDNSQSEWGFPVVVGLQTPDSAVRVLGVAATSPVLRKKIHEGSREFCEQSFALQAKDKSTVPLDSQGVIGSFHHAERMIRQANKQELIDLVKATPEQQGAIVWRHIGRSGQQREEDEARTVNAPALPQPRHTSTSTDTSESGDPVRAK